MIDWRYCGRFNHWTQNAIPEPNLTWIDEAEAKRRYPLPAQELALIPVLQDPSGIVPWHINVTTGENPSFMITFQLPPGVPESRVRWRNVGNGRLFAHEAHIWDYPEQPPHPMLRMKERDALMRFDFINYEDGTGRLLIYEKGSRDITTADRRIDPTTMYAPVPAWGHWDELANRDAPHRPERHAGELADNSAQDKGGNG